MFKLGLPIALGAACGALTVSLKMLIRTLISNLIMIIVIFLHSVYNVLSERGMHQISARIRINHLSIFMRCKFQSL